MANRLIFAVACCAGLYVASATAQELTDPTRPAVALETAVPSGEGAVEADQSMGLRLIIIQKKRRAAIIDGKTVELGGKVGDARLVAVNEGSVVLQGAQGRQVLTLFPGIKMNPIKATETPLKVVKSSGKNKSKPVVNQEEK